MNACQRELVMLGKGHVVCRRHHWRGPIREWWHGPCPEARRISEAARRIVEGVG